ncbi:MAG TPA: DUF559 domain-containing protein [Solirubrobacteraceae bacterium]|nr:DUF559 domain-containing protein [Solirubrobacteraceae bacterium]
MISRAQLVALGVADSTVAAWIASGYLTRVLPKVYAVGHTAPSRAAALWAAVLYAGPGAQLSHRSAAHHRGLIMHPPEEIHVSTPREKVRSIRGAVHVHGQRTIERSSAAGIPTTTPAQTVLDLAGEPHGLRLVRRALAVLEYRGELDRAALEAICGKGRSGSRTLREALAAHQPELAHTNGALEEALLGLCERFGLSVPRFNRRVCGFAVDAYWPEHRLVVELDGHRNHSTPAQLRRDRRRELTLRANGIAVVRYSWDLVRHRGQEVADDLVRQGVRSAPRRSTLDQ